MLNVDEIYGHLEDRTVLVTGDDGSIGSELCRQIALSNPKKVIAFDIHKNNAYDLQNRLLTRFKRLNLEVLIGSARDTSRVNHVFEVYRPDVVFRTVAHKRTPLMELNPGEAVKNSVLSTLNTAKIADKYGMKRIALIPTDKAMNPINAMGATKHICELVIQHFDRHNRTDSAAMCLDNVLGSNDSVISLFREQIASGGSVTVTHPDIIRYFMTTPEAARLVL